MAVQLTSEQTILESGLDDPYIPSLADNLITPTHIYELSQSESMNFLFNLLHDEDSILSNSDILSILTAMETREKNLPFSYKNDHRFVDTNMNRSEYPTVSLNSSEEINHLHNNQFIQNSYECDIQGIRWPVGLKEKFAQDRHRIGHNFASHNTGWFFNIPRSRDKVKSGFQTFNDYFQYKKFYGKIKLNFNHFQLRNLVCCGKDISKGVFYPSAYFDEDAYGNRLLDSDVEDMDHGLNYYRINRLSPDGISLINQSMREPMKLDCVLDSRALRFNSNSKISTLSCSDDLLVCGNFEGSYVMIDISNPELSNVIGEYKLTNKEDGITNHVVISEDNKELIVSSNDKHLRIVDIDSPSSYTPRIKKTYRFPFAINCSAINKNNTNQILFTGDDINSYILDTRMGLQNVQTLKGHEDHGFCCDWSPTNEYLVITGNQDGTVKLWDTRNLQESIHCWDSSLGRSSIDKNKTDSIQGAPVRNTKFSHNGDYICWAECLDHIGLLPVNQLLGSKDNDIEGVQSIEFIGKCTGLNFVPSDSGYGEELIIGIHDQPLGGILNYKLDSVQKTLDFDF